MKIYEQKPKPLVRIQVAKLGEDTQYLTLEQTTRDEVEQLIRDIITAQKIDPFATGHRTRIDIRDAIGSKNGKSKSVSFKGLPAKKTMDLIIRAIKLGQKAKP